MNLDFEDNVRNEPLHVVVFVVHGFLRHKVNLPQGSTSSFPTPQIKIEKPLPQSKALHLYNTKLRLQVLLLQERTLAN